MAKRVFFSFHYQDVIDFRANVVRNSWMTKKDRESAGFFDASIWETAKKTGVIALKRLINKGLDNTSTTVVLIGDETYNRRWVHYEIMKSINKGNTLFGLHINKIKGKNGKIKNYGVNPFDYLGIEFSNDGMNATPIVFHNKKWNYYKDLNGWKLEKRVPQKERGQAFQLSHWHKTYCWKKDNGYENFASWVL